ncbi:RES family NAD+ phosphorylase [Actinokineospora auranticolor]|uniref:RES domain-containing protein n=1 Tax=Actinokineospora auranticolor TaxID=155976 RepID=A0A2S6GNS6_9PSEU|nr:RES family NAD+ phosphorylase [Actinokineospora auranticolor]PPK66836.1 RES domain-containing protein [Actinokineospora auranticolor]
MSRLPQPPAPEDLKPLLRVDEDVVALHSGTHLVRIFAAAGAHRQRWNSFRYTGPLPHARFDPQPLGPDAGPATAPGHGVLYFGLSVRTCVAEVFQQTSVVDRTTRKPHLVVFRPRRTLRLLDLCGLWPTRAGASQEMNSGTKTTTQAWARAIREAYPDLDGVWYRSSMDSGEPAVCLWDPPASGSLPRTPDVLLPLDYPGLDLPLARVCEELNYTLL